MKRVIRTVVASLLALSLLLSLISCSTDRDADDILFEFCSSYPLESEVYYSLSEDSVSVYRSYELMTDILGDECDLPEEYAIVVHSKLNTVSEIAVLVTRDSSQRARLTELFCDRIAFLESFLDHEGFILRRRDLIIYGFVSDKDRAVRIFEDIL